MGTVHLLRPYNDKGEVGTSLHRLREVGNAYQILFRRSKEKYHFGNIRIEGRIMWKWIFKNLGKGKSVPLQARGAQRVPGS